MFGVILARPGFAVAQHAPHRVARDLQDSTDVAQGPTLAVERQDALAQFFSDHGPGGLRQRGVQALELGLHRGKGPHEVVALPLLRRAGKQRRDLRSQALEDLAHHRQILAPSPFGPRGQALALPRLLGALQGLEEEVGVFHQAFALHPGGLLVMAEEALERPRGKGLALELGQ